eukprot:TRINITY_DN15026_c0_g1_i1.p1 TRINITY_DN15026_c0_g1~~TRINITY_DN15026_c0_g1_i1.p1  ORF type:complete len:406 (-),score=60.89 TRINITY_DN15026_c0_g1_i1:204-1421(-)
MVMDVLMIGAGEYTAGYVPTKDGAASDKPAGVVAVTLFDLRRFGKVNRLVMCDVSGLNFPAVRANLQNKIGRVYKDMDLTLETFPPDGTPFAPESYKAAILSMKAGDMVTIFTPDDTHFDIAMAAIEHGLHVLVAKPAVKTLAHHLQLCEAAKRKGVLVAVEFHKRFDPIYTDARDRIRSLGAFSFFSSTMSQPKKQLDTFAGWAGKSSDISFYLNSHHIDFLTWSVAHPSIDSETSEKAAGECKTADESGVASSQGDGLQARVRQDARPVRVVGMASTGEAQAKLQTPYRIEDTITLMVHWQNSDGTTGTSVHMASWIAPPTDCHTQQYFHYMGTKGELRVDQAHRGYSGATDEAGYASLNPLYMKYTPSATGHFAGQHGYGYRSIAEFVAAAEAVSALSLSQT